MTIQACALAGLVLSAVACDIGPRVARGPSAPLTGSEAVWTTPGNSAQSLLAEFGWQQDPSPLFTDDQRLHKSATEFGDYVWIAPRPELDTMSTFGAGADGVLVALLHLTPDAPGSAQPQTYLDLQLSEGLNCIYLRRAGSVASGFVRKANPAAPRCPNTYSNATPIPVTPLAHPSFPDPVHIPAVARFHEGTNTGLQIDNAPYFGLKCFNAWCAFIPSSVTPRQSPQVATGDGMENQIPGWGDAQHLSIPTDESQSAAITVPTAPRPLKPSEMDAWIVPEPGIKTWTKADYLAEYRHVATVRFGNNPRHKYKERWHFGPHTVNNIYIKADDLTANRWTGYMVRRTYVLGIPMPWRRRVPLNVTRDDHGGMTVPATARFRWDALDEDLWIMCEDGCCRVSDS